MSEENMICIDSKLSNSIRKYKEFDNILYTIGVDNIVLGLIKISSVSSEKEEANSTIDDSFLKNLKNTIPVGMYLNGAIAIYNENTFEDFETVLNEQVEKIKELNKELLIGKSEDDIKYLQLALKELLYLDDEDDFTFEFKKLGENTDDSVEVNFSDNLIKKYFSGSDAKYKFLVHHVEVLFNNQKDIDGLENFIELKKEQLSDEKALDDIIDGSKNKGIILKLKQQDLIIDENFDDQQNFTDIKVDEYNKTNSNINKLYYANVQLGVKKNNDDEQIIENIKITDIDLENELKTNLYLETIGVMTSECKDNEKLLKSMLSQLKDNIKNLLQEENKFNQKVILYNELFNSIPFTLSALTPISLADNKLSIKQTKENKTMVKDDIKLIVIGDNPGKNEQLKKNQRYLVGQAGKLGENFFKNNPELGIDFRKNVIILNKTPVHTAKTNHLKYLEKNSVRAKMLIEESQKWMAKKTAELHHNLLSADLENSVELWLVGYGELKAKGIFSAYKKELKENYKEKKDWEKVFVFRHFSMNSFSNEFNKIHKEKADLKVKEILEKLGTMHKNDIFGTD